ncbi:hypothetical protein M0R45_020037 [Rubus argutus]|uniref:Uncharacterized protein n=1 Tax=Rubus argutus TaxID=59490 RepID=A0AAW1X8W0_RUBAR
MAVMVGSNEDDDYEDEDDDYDYDDGFQDLFDSDDLDLDDDDGDKKSETWNYRENGEFWTVDAYSDLEGRDETTFGTLVECQSKLYIIVPEYNQS